MSVEGRGKVLTDARGGRFTRKLCFLDMVHTNSQEPQQHMQDLLKMKPEKKKSKPEFGRELRSPTTIDKELLAIGGHLKRESVILGDVTLRGLPCFR